MAQWMDFSRKLAIVVAGLTVIAAPVASSQSTQAASAGAVQSPTYEVVSIRPSKADTGARVRFTADGLTAISAPLQMVIMLAYDLKHDPNLSVGGQLIPGGPKWILSDQYDIQTRTSDADIAALQKLDQRQRLAQERLMLQALLRDRFNLKIHFETKETPAYSLVVMKDGPRNLKKEPDNAKAGFDRARDHLSFHASSISDFVQILTQEMRRPVLDDTRLKGKYDLSLAWSLDSDGNPIRGVTAAQEDATSHTTLSGVTIITAIKEQLGMKLVAIKAPIKSPVIDRVERPSPN